MSILARRSDLDIGIQAFAEISGQAWDVLFHEAGPAHPYYSRAVIAAHREAGLLPADARFLTVSVGPRLLALLPFRLRRDLTGLGGLVARPFLTPYVTSSEPLLASGGDRGIALAALVQGLALASGGRAWRWPMLAVTSETGEGLLLALSEAGWRHGRVAAFERPVLSRKANHAAFLEAHPHRSRLKDLRRRFRRLGALGDLMVESASEGEALRRAIDAFLVLEKAGWKGEAGTALACRPETTRLAHGLFAPTEGPVRGRSDALVLDGRPIAISLALTGGGVATLLKTAYDESLRSHAPGLLLEAEIVRLCHESAFVDRLDSASLGGAALGEIYCERATIAEIIAVPPRAEALSLERRLRLAEFERRGREAAKRALRSNRAAGPR